MMAPFAAVRKQRERQYLDAVYDPKTGLSTDEIAARLEKHRAECPEEPRILTRAWLFHLLCSEARLTIEPDEPFAGKLEHARIMIRLRSEWRREAEPRVFKNDPPLVPGAAEAILDTSHTCPDWRAILALGFPGLRHRAAGRTGVFYQAVTRVYEGAITVIRRLDAVAPNPALAPLAERPPRTLHEALQLALLFDELQEMEGEQVRSMGRFDRFYGPFFHADLEAGRLTREHAKELLKYFWIKFFAKSQGKEFGKPFLFGPDANALTRLSFEVFREMHIVDPKFHLRLSDRTAADFVDQALECIQAGRTGIVLADDKKLVDLMRKHGKSDEDAEEVILIGCYEPAVMGKEMNWSGGSHLNLAKAVELTLAGEDPPTFEALMEAYLRTLDEQFTRLAERARRFERLWPELNPSPFLSGTMASCIETGRDVSQGGAKYNTLGCVCAGLANAVDSLAVIRQWVYEEERLSLSDLRAVLAADWEGFEDLRLRARHRVPKWGNNEDRVDALAVQITDFLATRINREPNARGGTFSAALYVILDNAQKLGADTGALPDGRHAGEPLTMNVSATAGLEKNGATALIRSATKIDLTRFPGGTVLDVLLHPSAVQGAKGIETLRAIVESHFAQGGMAIQFNVFDADVLREARKNPEPYANLQVRVCGWNVRFADLAPEEQDLFIAKAEAAQ